ncbi:MAG TPA: serine/threonine-protein kinase, partial [Solirubrobacteraceae bacterium]|nr:serine/threonine-protein kinase [Solirubrobacteraceae bacterium]
MTDFTPGMRIAGCRIEAIAGRGGMGVIYRATELRLDRPVAVKLIASDRAAEPAFRERFERESRLTAAIDHPNVIPVYAAGEEAGRLYLVMRYVAGTDLRSLLERDGRLAPSRAADVVAQVGAGLDAAHEAGLVHRDVKPANILIAGGGHVYLSDFGITRVVDSETRLTDSDGWVGTVDYMAPEHLEGGETDARTDVYALGCVLFTALTGAPPFRRDSVPATITAHLRDAPPRPSEAAGVPQEFDAVVARALAKRPADRYPSAGDLGRAAAAAARGERVTEVEQSVARGPAAPPPPPPPLPAPEPPTAAAPTRHMAQPDPVPPAPAAAPTARLHRRPRPRPRRLLAVLAGAVLAAAGAGAIVALSAGDGTPSGPLTAAEVRSATAAFARAYSREDPAALGRTLTPDVRRVAPGDL